MIEFVKEYLDIIIVVFTYHSLWAIYAMSKQVKCFGWNWWRILLAGLLNLILCPICVIIAISKE